MLRRVGWLLAGSVTLASCKGRCDLAEAVVARAGADAIDCGHVSLGGDATTTDACVRRSVEAAVPFYAIYERQGLDSHAATGITRRPDGSVTILSYDGDPGGGGGDGHPVIYAQRCEGATTPRPAVGGRDSRLPLDCSSLGEPVRICPRPEAA